MNNKRKKSSIDHYRNEVYVPEFYQVGKGQYVVVQKKLYSVDKECIDLRWHFQPSDSDCQGKYKNAPKVMLSNGIEVIPCGYRGLFLDCNSFENGVMPNLRKLFPEKPVK